MRYMGVGGCAAHREYTWTRTRATATPWAPAASTTAARAAARPAAGRVAERLTECGSAGSLYVSIEGAAGASARNVTNRRPATPCGRADSAAAAMFSIYSEPRARSSTYKGEHWVTPNMT
jgi:hypothetical protein